MINDGAAYEWRLIDNLRWSLLIAEAELEDARRTLEAERTHSGNLAKSFAKALGERDAAILVIEEINGEAQMPECYRDSNKMWDALKRIRAKAEKGLNRG